MNCLELLRGDTGGAVRQVRVKGDRLELKTLDADYVFAFLALPTRRAEPVLVLKEQIICSGQGS